MEVENQPMEVDDENEEARKPLTDWKNPPTLANLKRDLEEALPIQRQQKEKIDGWLDNLYVKGKAKINTKGNSSAVQPKLIRKQAEWRYPALSEPFLSTDKLFDVKPTTWEDREAAIQNELVLNNQFNSYIDKVSFIDDYVRTLVDEGTAILRTSWVFEEEVVEEEVPIVQYRPNVLVGPLHEQIAALKAQSPSQYMTDVPDHLKTAHDMTVSSGVPVEAVVLGYETKKVSKIIRNHPNVEVCDYRNVYIDPTCQGNLDKAKFVIYSFESSKSDLEREGIYSNLDQIKIGDHSVLADPDHSSESESKNFDFEDQPRRKLVVYEYWGFWDIDGTGVVKPFVAAWVGNTLIRLEENPYPDKKVPFVVVPYLPVRKSVYGEPDGALLEDNQKIIGAVMRGMIDLLAKSANSQTGMRKDMLDATNRRKWERGQDYEFNGNVDPRQGIHQHTFPEIPVSAQFMIELMNMDAESLTGVKNFNQGISGASLGEVAAGVRGALDASSKRELAILRRLAKGVIQVGRKFISMNSEFLSEEEVVRITNDEFVTVKRDDLAGQFDLKLTISTAEEDASKAQELAFMLQTMGNNLEFGITKMILMDIARLRKMPDLAKKIENFEPQPNPLDEQIKQLEIEKLMAEIEEIRSRAMKNQTGAALDQAKTGTEQVKQGNIQSDTDLKNLDFVEQESGVTQERDLQKQRAQAEAQGRMKLIDQSTQMKKMETDLIKEAIRASAKKAV